MAFKKKSHGVMFSRILLVTFFVCLFINIAIAKPVTFTVDLLAPTQYESGVTIPINEILSYHLYYDTGASNGVITWTDSLSHSFDLDFTPGNHSIEFGVTASTGEGDLFAESPISEKINVTLDVNEPAKSVIDIQISAECDCAFIIKVNGATVINQTN